jgi:hypothetical protein
MVLLKRGFAGADFGEHCAQHFVGEQPVQHDVGEGVGLQIGFGKRVQIELQQLTRVDRRDGVDVDLGHLQRRVHRQSYPDLRQ